MKRLDRSFLARDPIVAFVYAGWGPDHREHEIQVHARAIAEADPALVFVEDCD